MEWLQVSPFLSEVPWNRATFRFLAILGHENFCYSPEVLEPSLAERPCSHWGGLATFPGHISSYSQNPHRCSHFRSGGNQFLIFCHLPWPFLSFPLGDIMRNLIKGFRFLQKYNCRFEVKCYNIQLHRISLLFQEFFHLIPSYFRLLLFILDF